MSAETRNITVKKKSGELVPVSEIKLDDEIAIDTQVNVFGKVAAINSDALIVETDSHRIITALTEEFANVLKEIIAHENANKDGEDVDREGFEGETGGADLFSPYPFVDSISNRLVREINERSSKSNTDITDQNSNNIGGLSSLKPGDILLKMMDPNDTVSGGINILQKTLNALSGYKDSSKLTHATLYCGKVHGKHAVIEAVNKGVGVSPLRTSSDFNGADYNKSDFYVLRCKHDDIVQKALQAATQLVHNAGEFSKAGDRVKVGYAHTNLYLNAGSQTVMGLQFSDLVRYKPGPGETTSEFPKKIRDGRAELFCSELVAYCYHTACDQVRPQRERFFRGIRQDRISPEHLYVLGRTDGDNFRYVGRLKAGMGRE